MRYEIRGTMDDQGERQEVDDQSYPQGATCLPQAGKGSEILPFGPPRSTWGRWAKISLPFTPYG